MYTVAISFFLWHAFFGQAPNDAGIIIFFLAIPATLLTEFFDYGHFCDAIAAALHQPVSDRFAMSLDATVGWALGCIQYSAIGVMLRKDFRNIKRSGA
jgi:hypothetical protein